MTWGGAEALFVQLGRAQPDAIVHCITIYKHIQANTTKYKQIQMHLSHICSTWHWAAWCHCALYYFIQAHTNKYKQIHIHFSHIQTLDHLIKLQFVSHCWIIMQTNHCCKIATILPFCIEPLLFPVAYCNLSNGGVHILLWWTTHRIMKLSLAVSVNCICICTLYFYLYFVLMSVLCICILILFGPLHCIMECISCRCTA